MLLQIPERCRLNSVEETRELDHQTINEFGIDGFTLMEIAGAGAADWIKTNQGPGKKGLFLCGKGNNAGDALVAARYLTDKSAHSAIILFVLGDEDLSPDTTRNLSLLKKLQENGANIRFLNDPEDANFLYCDYVVDGLFGTGLNSALRPPVSAIIQKANKSGLPVFAMDVPSGLDADSGEIYNVCIRANHTFTFGTNKIGFYLGDAASYTGDVHFISLPFPSWLNPSKTWLLDDSLNQFFPEPDRDARHKYEKGVVHILAGSEGLTGAAVMAAKSAWKTGAGSVILYAPKKLMPVYEKNLPQVIKIGIGAENDGYFKESHSEEILKKMEEKPGALVAGPGVGTQSDTGACILQVLKQCNGHVVLDADLFAFWEQIGNLPDQKKEKWLLTPHIGEAKKYLEAGFKTDKERLGWVTRFTETHGCSFLLKGQPTIACAKGVRIITGYDTSAFSRAGFGDVLAGSLGTYLAITNKPVLSCVKALYNGYQSYEHHHINEPFGPEHLI